MLPLSLPLSLSLSLSLPQFLKKHRHRIGLVYFVAGIVIGFVLCWLFLVVPPPQQLQLQSLSQSQLHEEFTETNNNGWASIHVYRGTAATANSNNNTTSIPYFSSIHPQYYQAVRWYSQARQDEVVAALLKYKKHGTFIDLAANDAIKISNTFALEHHYSWKGICIEPNPMYWPGLALYRTNCHVVAAVVGKLDDEQVWFHYPTTNKGPLGGIVGFDNSPSNQQTQKLVTTTTLSTIFQKFNMPYVIDYLSLDVEGAEDFIMTTFPFQHYQFKIITLERPSTEMKQIMHKHGYTLWKYLKLAKTNETLWYHSSMKDDLDFDTASTIDTMCVYRETYSDNHPHCQLKGPLSTTTASGG